MVVIPDLSAIQHGLPNRRWNTAPIIAALALAAVGAGGYYLEQRWLPNFWDIFPHTWTPEISASTIINGSVFPNISGTLPVQVLPPQTSYTSGVVPATSLPHPVSTPAVKETSPLAHPISFSPDMPAVFDLFLYTLSDADKLSLQAIHAAGTQLDTNDTALFTLVSQLVTPKGQEITYYEKWDAELTASMFDMIKNGESWTNILTILEIYETVTTDPNKIIQLQNFLNVTANGSYNSQTNTALNSAFTDNFDSTYKKLESIASGIPSPVDTTALEVKAAMVATFDIPAPKFVIPNMHPKSIATPQVLPVVSATAGTTPSTVVKTHGEGTMNIESAQPNVSGVEIVESLSKLPLDDYPLGSAFVLNPDGTPNFKRWPIQIADAEWNLDGNNNLQDWDVVFIKLSDAKGTFFAQVTVDKEWGYSHYVDQKIFETK